MQDIADRVGVTRATVSMALRGDPRITAARRAEVAQVAAELGYRPNPQVASLMTQLRLSRRAPVSTFLGFLCFHDHPEIFGADSTELFHRTVFAACREQSEELGYAFELIWVGQPGMRPERMDQILHTRATAGVIVAPVSRGTATNILNYRDRAVVKIGYSAQDLPSHRVVPDHAQAMRRVLRHLREAGYHRIGFVFNSAIDHFTQGEFTAFVHAHNALVGTAAVPPLMSDHYHRPAELRASVQQYFAAYRPEVIVSDQIRPLRALQETGLKVPGDVEFCCLNTAHTVEQCAGFHQNLEVIGRETVLLLDNLIRHNRRGLPEVPLTIKVGGYWTDGPTLSRPIGLPNRPFGKTLA